MLVKLTRLAQNCTWLFAGKNTKKLGKIPLISYSIDFALQNKKQGDEICISTDDENVIDIAEQKGIKILKKGIMKDGGYKYTEIKVKYDDLKNKLND